MLEQFLVAFDCLIFMRFSIKLIHDLDAKTAHSPAQVLDNVKAIEDDFRRRKELSGDVVIGTEHVHGDDLDAVSDLSGMAEKVIANGCLRSPVED